MELFLSFWVNTTTVSDFTTFARCYLSASTDARWGIFVYLGTLLAFPNGERG